MPNDTKITIKSMRDELFKMYSTGGKKKMRETLEEIYSDFDQLYDKFSEVGYSWDDEDYKKEHVARLVEAAALRDLQKSLTSIVETHASHLSTGLLLGAKQILDQVQRGTSLGAKARDLGPQPSLDWSKSVVNAAES